MATDITSLFNSKANKRPKLDLKPEESLVLSTDFNLFYKPEVEPEIAGLKEFTDSLSNFVNDGMSSMVIASKYKEKEVNYAEAKKDYELNKGKFRKAVKDGSIDVTGNPYYLEHYKELTLNDWANKFAEKLDNAYENKGVLDDTRDGAFDAFYKAQMETFVKENDLGFFTPLELEKGFFSKTSANRSIIENNHRQKQSSLIKGKFDEKVINNTFGVIAKYKTMANDSSISFDTIIKGIADELNVSISAIEGVTSDGTHTIDTIFKGIEGWITSTTDFEFAKKVMAQLPSKLLAGNNSIENIGRIKKKTNDLMGLLIANEEAHLKSESDLVLAQEQAETIKTHKFLDSMEDDKTFNIMEWRNSPERTNTEILTSDKWIKMQHFDGGSSSNPEVTLLIFEQLSLGNYEEADKIAEENFFKKEYTKTDLQLLRTTTIPNYQNHKDKPIFNHPKYVEVMNAIESTIQQTQKGGDKLQAVKAQMWIEQTMLEWYDENYKKYIGNNSEFRTAFLKEFSQNISVIQTTKSADDSLLFTAFNYSGGNMSIESTFEKLDQAKDKLKK